MSALLVLLKSPDIKRKPVVIQNEENLVPAISSFVSSRFVPFCIKILFLYFLTCRAIPIFLISNVTGENMSLLLKFLNLLPRPTSTASLTSTDDVEFRIEETYSLQRMSFIIFVLL